MSINQPQNPPGEVLFESVVRVIQHLNLSSKEVHAMLGCTETKLRELLAGEDFSFIHKPTRHATYLIRIFLALGKLFSHEVVDMRNWMRCYNQSLKTAPIARLVEEQGFETVVDFLESSLSR